VGRQPRAAETADAIVPLGGADVRKRYAVELYRRGVAPNLVLLFNAQEEYGRPFGAAGRIPDEAVAYLREEVGVPPERIHVIRTLTSTVDEAVAVRDLAVREGWRRIYVVDTAFHSRRSRWIFGKAMRETEVEVVFVPVPFAQPDGACDPACVRPALPSNPRARDDVSVRAWWTREDELLRVFTEYVKFGLYVARYSLRPLPTKRAPHDAPEGGPPAP
jgi:uncharacterized SAM-binding protein YcdF (DUF218 family)